MLRKYNQKIQIADKFVSYFIHKYKNDLVIYHANWAKSNEY